MMTESAFEMLHALSYNFGPWDTDDSVDDIMSDLRMVDEDSTIIATVTPDDVTAFVAYYSRLDDGTTAHANTTAPPCEAFAMCDNQSDRLLAHPILGWFPSCKRCADRLDAIA